MIIDYINIRLTAGCGGEGNYSLMPLGAHRYIGGGGNGGNGGNIILRASPHLYDLNKFKGHQEFRASDGDKGSTTNKHGSDAKHLFLNVPVGTLVFEGEKILADMALPNQEFLICKGGRHGEGNFKKDFVLPPESGEAKDIILDYRIPHDIAVIGLANCGKTSLVNALTNQNFKVADYPFTTLSCAWAVGKIKNKSAVIMDTQPLRLNPTKALEWNLYIKHLYRSKVILILSDNLEDYRQEFKAIEKEILSLDPEVFLRYDKPKTRKKVLYVLTKVDTIKPKRLAKNVIAVSTIDDESMDKLAKELVKALS